MLIGRTLFVTWRKPELQTVSKSKPTLGNWLRRRVPSSPSRARCTVSTFGQAKPTPQSDETGTSCDSTLTPDTGKNSRPPARSCDSMSQSLPSWLFGNTLIRTCPIVSFRIRSQASIARMFSGCDAGTLVPKR